MPIEGLTLYLTGAESRKTGNPSLDVKLQHGVDVSGEVGEKDERGEGVAAVGCHKRDQRHGGQEGAPRHRRLLL